MANNYRYGERRFAALIESMNGVVQDLTGCREAWEVDIDFRIFNPENEHSTYVEVKWDSCLHYSQNLFVEYANPRSRNGLGWFHFTKADFLAYGDTTDEVFHWFKVDELRQLVEENKHRYRKVTTGDEAAGYLVPLSDVKQLPSYRLLKD